MADKPDAQDEGELGDEFEEWARQAMRHMRETAAAVTEELGLPPDKQFTVMRAIFEPALERAMRSQENPREATDQPSSFVQRALDRIERMERAGAAAAEAVGDPPEARYDWASVMYRDDVGKDVEETE